ncbi:hypothetical protein Q4561_08010 [Alteromonas sp. 1_MG-2023]|uniref:hypothetical protein n=1 Tax=Alteromonas sp. 1_MG-2023 TaxID=3062669 RepID=UPI0026E1DC18|nr:hypothetical protein [Alteromonas sp. 1_MG-2023]MDO6567002.1 hypothetical protein [Alteromonas sp. 1_MG-2023]
MNLLLLLLTMSFLVPENGASSALGEEITQVSKEISIQYAASESQEQASDKDELDDGAYFLSTLWASTTVPNTRSFSYSLSSNAGYAAHLIRAPPRLS